MGQYVFIIFLSCTVSITSLYGQLKVIKYSICSDCPLSDNSAEYSIMYNYHTTPADYTPREITSDYGARNLSQYDWHNGIDLRPYPPGSADTHRGTAIQSIEQGQIEHIKFLKGGYKYIVIGDPSSPSTPKYGYGHIFNSLEVPTNPLDLLSDGNFFMTFWT